MATFGPIQTISVEGYNVKFCMVNKNAVKVSIPGYFYIHMLDTSSSGIYDRDSEYIPETFDETFIAELKSRGWSGKAVKKLNKYIITERWCDYVEMDIKTGKITYE
jgi:hypothetical protein